MDVQMPEMDGLEATRRLRDLAPGLPVIGQTAHALLEEREKCRIAGMVDHLCKPIDLEDLVAAVLRHARRGSAEAGIASADLHAPGSPPEVAARISSGILDWSALTERFHGNRDIRRTTCRNRPDWQSGDAGASAPMGGRGQPGGDRHRRPPDQGDRRGAEGRRHGGAGRAYPASGARWGPRRGRARVAAGRRPGKAARGRSRRVSMAESEIERSGSSNMLAPLDFSPRPVAPLAAA